MATYNQVYSDISELCLQRLKDKRDVGEIQTPLEIEEPF